MTALISSNIDNEENELSKITDNVKLMMVYVCQGTCGLKMLLKALLKREKRAYSRI